MMVNIKYLRITETVSLSTKLYKKLEEAVKELYFLGIDKKDVLNTVEKVYKGGNNDD